MPERTPAQWKLLRTEEDHAILWWMQGEVEHTLDLGKWSETVDRLVEEMGAQDE